MHHCRYLGKKYPLELLEQNREQGYQGENRGGKTLKPEATFDGTTFFVSHSQGDLKSIEGALKQLFTKDAKKLITQRLALYQPQIKTKFKSFSIESHPDKWGSCSSARHLTFHWMLMCYSLEVIDYVVIHELCHLEHLNHDRSFWRLVGKVCPNYKGAMALLGVEKTRDL